jgi:hypothetical protein
VQHPPDQYQLHSKMSSRRSQRRWDASQGRLYDPIGSDQNGTIPPSLRGVYPVNHVAGNYPSTWLDESEIVATDNPYVLT